MVFHFPKELHGTHCIDHTDFDYASRHKQNAKSKYSFSFSSFVFPLLKLLWSPETEEIKNIGDCKSILYKITQDKTLKDLIYKKQYFNFTFKNNLHGLSILENEHTVVICCKRYLNRKKKIFQLTWITDFKTKPRK